jgi:hypothetical protein
MAGKEGLHRPVWFQFSSVIFLYFFGDYWKGRKPVDDSGNWRHPDN